MFPGPDIPAQMASIVPKPVSQNCLQEQCNACHTIALRQLLLIDRVVAHLRDNNSRECIRVALAFAQVQSCYISEGMRIGAHRLA